MKKLIPLLLILTLLVSAGCTSGTPQAGETPDVTATPEPTPAPAIIDAGNVDALTEQWIAAELSFTSETSYKKEEVFFDVSFKNRETGTTLLVPGFWDGDNTFRVRFAPTECGIWDYTTQCDGDASISGLTGTVGANAYTGDLAIYQHGFIKAESGTKYLMYADGTPFFYLGDTHWTMLTEEFDKAGSNAGSIKTDSHFKYIVDKRVEQGFTVYQSEPIDAAFTLTDGIVNKSDIRGLQKADKYFQYLAEKGLVHANAEFFFSSGMTESLAKNEARLRALAHHWVARFGAYPVMWTLAQEIDNDYYYERTETGTGGHNGHPFYDFSNNPWVKIAEYIHEYDAYAHPLSGHQESTGTQSVTGSGVNYTGNAKNKYASDNGRSAFLSDEVTEKTGHSWWAAQWKPVLDKLYANDDLIARDYYASPKPAVNYESRYCYLWTKDFGARAQGWISFLSGFCGYGYGAVDIWYYKSNYDTTTTTKDGVDTVTPEDKATPWSTAVEFESGYQVCYMRAFFEQFDWWKLTPEFRTGKSFLASTSSVLFQCASNGNEDIVVYFYDLNQTATGSFKGLDKDAEYTVTWFNPRTGEYGESQTFSGQIAYTLSARPTNGDWVVRLSKVKA